MSTGQLLLSSPSFLDTERLRTGLSLVWCAKVKQKNKSFKHQWKRKAGVPVTSHRYTHETNKKNTTVLALTRCPLDRAKNKNKIKTYNRRWESLVFHLTNRFCFCSLWQRRNPSRHRETILRQWVSQVLCFHVQPKVNTSARRNEGTSIHTPRFHIYSERTGVCGRRKEGKRNLKGDITLWMWRKGQTTHKHTPAPLQNKGKKTWESRNLREADTGLLHWGSRNEGELRILGKLRNCRKKDEPNKGRQCNSGPWEKRMSMAVEGRRGSWTKSRQVTGPRVHRGWSTCLQLCGGTPRLLWCRYPEATQICVAP